MHREAIVTTTTTFFKQLPLRAAIFDASGVSTIDHAP